MEEPKTLKERIQKLLESMNQGLYEREEILKMVLLTSLAGENVLLLGLPG
ncbi:MAG: hypothetical protein H7A23_24190 [Leptospiraceae bacterium]|nr:hypothetical protein [Leptospiraceae bacterium]MCP5497665.1 hypothetical protein [Leptospiraceae bacterium]